MQEQLLFSTWTTTPTIRKKAENAIAFDISKLMQNQLIFRTWIITPTIRKKVKEAITFDKSKILIKSFYSGPKKIESNSMINYLKQNLGIKVGKVDTFKTDFISSKKFTLYNGHKLSLRVNNDVVELLISEGTKSGTLNAWDIEKLTSTLKIKNQSYGLINKENVAKLITDGELMVKFNVSAIKDHGTMWKLG